MAVSPAVEAVLQKLGLVAGPAPARLKPRYASTAVVVSPERVGAVRLAHAGRSGKGWIRPSLAAWKEVPIPPGAVVPSLIRTNLAEPAPVAEAVAAVLAEVAPRESQVSLVVPDSVARVSLLQFPRMPATRREVLELIRFRLQKVLPFRVEEAALDFQLLSDSSAPEPEFLVALAQRTLLFQYERLLTGMERLPGLVDLESFNLANLEASSSQAPPPGGDHALINAAPGSLTVLFFRDGRLIFYRSKSLTDEGPRASDNGDSSTLRRELASCAAFFREHLGGTALGRATLRAVIPEADALPAVVREELGCPVELLDPARAVNLPSGTNPADPRWLRLAPAIGAAMGRRG